VTSPVPTRPAAAARSARRDIQGLRALAVVAVVLCHAIGWPAGGFAGVDVFFVISGFLITGMLLRDVEAGGRVRFGHFYAARVRRILPVALLALAVVAGLGFVVFNGPRAWQTGWDAVWSALFTMNWHLALAGTDYFAAGGAESPLQHFWTLSVEEQFYVFWPLLVLLLVLAVPRRARRGGAGRIAVGLGAVAIAVASLWWGGLQTAGDPTVAYFSTATRAWELAAGAALAALSPILARLPLILGGALSWAGVAGIAASFVLLDPDSAMPVPGALLPVAATALVLAGGVAGDPRHRHLFVLTNPVSTFLGDMSYSLYVWHFPVIVFASVLLPAGGVTTLLVLAVIAVVSLVSYLAVEQPVHRSPLLRRFDGTRTPARVAEPSSPDDRQPQTRAASPEPVPHTLASASTRPAGWQPGRRYFPGAPHSAVLPVSAPRMPHPSPSPRELTASGSSPAAPGASAPAPAAASVTDGETRDKPAPEPAPRVDPREARREAWAAWRSRFRGQAAGAGAGLVVAAGVLVLVLQLTTGSSILPRFDLPTAGADTGTDQATAALGELQAELAGAATATAWPDLTPSMESVLTTGSADNPARDCFAPQVQPDIGACTWGTADAPHHLYLVGDSTAMAYAPAFRKIADDSGGTWRITTVGLYGCRFTDVLIANDGAGVMDACPARKDLVADAIRADTPDAVVVSNAFTLGHTVEGRDMAAAALAASVRTETDAYGLPGRIVYLSPPPEGAPPSVCFSPATGPEACLSGVDQTWRDMMAATQEVAAASGERAIDAVGLGCWEDVCPAFAGTTPVRYDQTHITVAFAEKIAPALREELAAAGIL
jgi:peptidoglycan/LPS O-acetylase OafA/YrhL